MDSSLDPVQYLQGKRDAFCAELSDAGVHSTDMTATMEAFDAYVEALVTIMLANSRWDYANLTKIGGVAPPEVTA